jgi:hypothetical protein
MMPGQHSNMPHQQQPMVHQSQYPARNDTPYGGNQRVDNFNQPYNPHNINHNFDNIYPGGQRQIDIAHAAAIPPLSSRWTSSLEGLPPASAFAASTVNQTRTTNSNTLSTKSNQKSNKSILCDC